MMIYYVCGLWQINLLKNTIPPLYLEISFSDSLIVIIYKTKQTMECLLWDQKITGINTYPKKITTKENSFLWFFLSKFCEKKHKIYLCFFKVSEHKIYLCCRTILMTFISYFLWYFFLSRPVERTSIKY